YYLHRLAGNRIARLEGWHLGRGKRSVGGAGGPVGRVCFRSFARHQSLAQLEPRPALFVGRDEVDVEVERADAPDAVGALRIGILIDPVAPFGVLLVLAEHAQVAPAAGRAS